MPDTTLPPGTSAALRDMNGRSSRLGGDYPSIIPDEPEAPAGLTRAQPPGYGAIATGERVGARWRDLEWVDFVVVPDGAADGAGDAGLVAPHAPVAAPDPVRDTAPAPAPPVRRRRVAAPDIGNALRRFAPPTEPPPIAESPPIPGLAARFVRVPVEREPPIGEPAPSEPSRMPAWLDRLADPPTTLPGVAPRPPATAGVERPAAAAADPPRPSSATPPRPALPPRVVPGVRDEAPFPASFYISTSTAPAAAPLSPLWSERLAAQCRRLGAAARRRSAVAAGRLAETLAHTAAAARRGIPARRTSHAIAPPPGPAAAGLGRVRAGLVAARSASGRAVIVAVARVGETANRWGRPAAGGDGGLRLSAWITLGVMLVAAIAYGGGALVARRSDADTQRSVADAKPYVASAQPLPAAQAVVLVAPPRALPGVDTPSSAATVHAASYLARAKDGDAAAQYDAGVLYATGDGLTQDYVSAVSWFQAAAAQGNVDAEYNLGVLYEQGLGVAADPAAALNWYRSAADQNHAGAQFNLGVAYAEGRGAAQDFTAASRWYLRAAQQGLVPAMVNLAILYERGDGVDRSPVDAYAWYKIAAEHGAADAKERAGQLFEQFSDEDKVRAEALAAMRGATLGSAKPPA